MQAAIARTKHGLFRYLPNDIWCGRSLELYGEWSDAEVGLLEQLLPKGATVVEVGAHLGVHTVPLAKHVGAEGRVLAFEPQGPIFALLSENLRENGVAWVEADRAAVGARKGHVHLPAIDYAAPEGNFGGASPLNGSEAGARVRLVTIDSLKLERLDLLKADVEGMEAEVVRGATETIRRCRPVLYLENDREEKSAELITLVKELGYRLWWHLPPLYHPENFRRNGVNVFPGAVSVNMLCIPAERSITIRHLREIRDPGEAWLPATRPHEVVHRVRRDGQETIAVLVPYAYGDALFASSVLHHLKRQGWHVTVYCDGMGEEILRHDPNVDRMLWLAAEEVTLGEISDFFFAARSEYTRALNLMEVVAKNLIAFGPDARFLWPDRVRREVFGRNYLELMHLVAEVLPIPQQRFYPTEDEVGWARSLRCLAHGPVAVLAASGSIVPKFWPYLDELADGLLARGFEVYILGDLRGQTFRYRGGLHAIGTEWTMRQACTWAWQADIVIGQETGLLNAVALERNAKIVLLSHSTAENLTRDWVNTIALSGAVACYPCHRLHRSFDYCARDAKTGTAMCQAAIPAERVLECVDSMVPQLAKFPGGVLAIAGDGGAESRPVAEVVREEI